MNGEKVSAGEYAEDIVVPAVTAVVNSWTEGSVLPNYVAVVAGAAVRGGINYLFGSKDPNFGSDEALNLLLANIPASGKLPPSATRKLAKELFKQLAKRVITGEAMKALQALSEDELKGQLRGRLKEYLSNLPMSNEVDLFLQIKAHEFFINCRARGLSVAECEEEVLKKLLSVVRSFDPNDIIGPQGFGPQGFLTPDGAFGYTIRFENQQTATAPAQEIFIRQQLDPDLDFSSFELGDVGFGALRVEVRSGRNFFQTRLDHTADRGIFIDVVAAFDPGSGLAQWVFRAIDHQTGDLPADPFIGLLPPNVKPPEGDGFVSYRIRPQDGLPTGTRVDAQARIVFDTNAPIDTPPILNTVDRAAPTSTVDPLPEVVDSSRFTVRWAGVDDAGGSGIAFFDVFVSDNGGPFMPFLVGASQTAASFNGTAGHSYAFYSIATDNVGQRQATPAQAQAVTRLLQAPPSVESKSPVVAGAQAGSGPEVKVFDAATGELKFSVMAFDPNFTGGVRVASGDVTGDGIADIIAGAGPGGGPNVRILDGLTGQQIRGPLGSFFPFNVNFTGGVVVDAADVTGDGIAEIIVGAGPGGGPEVAVYDASTGVRLRVFFAFEPGFTGGVRLAHGDVNGDGADDLIIGAGPGGGPNVLVVNGRDGFLIRSFFAFDPNFTGGVFVAAGDVGGDGKADIVVGAGPGGGPSVAVFDGELGTLNSSFFAYDPAIVAGVLVGIRDLDNSGRPEVLTGLPPLGTDLRAFEPLTALRVYQLFSNNLLFNSSVFEAGSR